MHHIGLNWNGNNIALGFRRRFEGTWTHLLDGLSEKLYIDPGRFACLLDLEHPLLCLFSIARGELERSVVGYEALVVVQVPVELELGLLGIGAFLVDLARLKTVALVVAPSTLPVLAPRTHADPAKFILTHLAHHMVASLNDMITGKILNSGG